MKRIFVIGIVLLALLALTGVVSAATEGKVPVAGDVVFRNLELQLNGGIYGWTLQGGDNSLQTSEIRVTNNGFAEGYTVTVADKMDQDMDYNPKPASTEGHLVAYSDENYGRWRWITSYSFPVCLANPLHILGGYEPDITLSSADQVLYSTTLDGHGIPDIYIPTYMQNIASTDKPASYYYGGADGYLLVITVTATPN